MKRGFWLLLATVVATAHGQAPDSNSDSGSDSSPTSVYTWIDAAGNTHYGDRPPDDVPVRELDSATLQPSIIGGGALRGSERDLLQQLRDEQLVREQRRAEQAAQRRQATEVTIINEAPERDRDGRPFYRSYYYPHRYGYKPPHRFGHAKPGALFDLDVGVMIGADRHWPSHDGPRYNKPRHDRSPATQARPKAERRPKPAGVATPRSPARRAATQNRPRSTVTRRQLQLAQ